MSPGLCDHAKNSLSPLPCHHRHFSILKRPRGNNNLLNNVNLKTISDNPEPMDTYLIEIISEADSRQLFRAVTTAKSVASVLHKPEHPPSHPPERSPGQRA